MEKNNMIMQKVISSGQTVPERYSTMQKMTRKYYPKRKEQNVIESDKTIKEILGNILGCLNQKKDCNGGF